MSQAGFPLSPAALLTLAADPVGSRSVLGEGLVGQSWARVRTLGVVFSEKQQGWRRELPESQRGKPLMWQEIESAPRF